MFSKLAAMTILLSIIAPSLALIGGTGGVSANRECDPFTAFSPGNFPAPTQINNQWSPLVPGTQFVLEGRANRGGGVLPHRVVFTVTDLTKVINGVRSVVMYDVDINAGEVVEAELAFFAQDNGGNIWTMGEFPAEFEGGVFTGAPSTWISGIAGAQAGVLVPNQVSVGAPAFLQGLAPAISFYDCARVLKTGEKVCAAGICYDNVLVIEEWSPLEQASGHQLKYYAPGRGNIQIGAVADREAETLVLTEVKSLSQAELTGIRQAALDLERRAYQVSDVYRQTPPAERNR